MYKRHIYSVWFSKLYGLFKKLMGFSCLTCFFIRNCKIYICIYLWKDICVAVYIDGKKIEGTGTERGVVFQQYALFPWLTVLKNVMFGLKLFSKHNINKTKREEINGIFNLFLVFNPCSNFILLFYIRIHTCMAYIRKLFKRRRQSCQSIYH